MLTQLSIVKSRLGIPDTDTQYDALLTSTIKAVSARFDKETNRTLARSTGITEEFSPEDTEIPVRCYPIESVTKFELKTDETSGWSEKTDIKYLIRQSCIISLDSAFRTPHSALCRVTYTAGYLLPGDPDPQPSPNNPQPVRLPADLEQAAVEQVAFWFQTREKLGLKISWPSGGTYQGFAVQDLLPGVASVLARYQRITL